MDSVGRYRPAQQGCSLPPKGLSFRTGIKADCELATLSDRALEERLASPLANCSKTGIDPDAWHPGAGSSDRARGRAAEAIAAWMECPLRLECLETSMRLWPTAGRHGIWGGFVESERAELRKAWQAGTPVTVLADLGSPSDHPPACLPKHDQAALSVSPPDHDALPSRLPGGTQPAQDMTPVTAAAEPRGGQQSLFGEPSARHVGWTGIVGRVRVTGRQHRASGRDDCPE